MNAKYTLLAAGFLSCAIARAVPVTVYFGLSNQNYTLHGTGAIAGFGTFLIDQGNCVPGVSLTICTLSGAFTGSTAGYTGGNYSYTSVYANSDGGLASITDAPVDYPNIGNFFTLGNVASDYDTTLSLFDNATATLYNIPIFVNGAFVAQGLSLNYPSGTCTGLPPAAPGCTIGEVSLYTSTSFFGQVTGDVTFDAPTPIPEPGFLALGAMLPGLTFLLRRHFNTNQTKPV